MISVPDHASIQPQYPITYSIQSTLPRAWIFNTTQLANLVVFAGFPKSAVSPYRPPSPVSSPVTTDPAASCHGLPTLAGAMAEVPSPNLQLRYWGSFSWQSSDSTVAWTFLVLKPACSAVGLITVTL